MDGGDRCGAGAPRGGGRRHAAGTAPPHPAEPSDTSDPATPVVSVVVVHYDDQPGLDRVLAALGRSSDAPRQVVVADDGSFQARTVMEICLSGDHRVIDGATGATFVGEVKAILESPAQMLV